MLRWGYPRRNLTSPIPPTPSATNHTQSDLQPGCNQQKFLNAARLTAPIASATSVAQVESFAKAANLSLTADDVAALDAASF